MPAVDEFVDGTHWELPDLGLDRNLAVCGFVMTLELSSDFPCPLNTI
jgi:hypothetical protein